MLWYCNDEDELGDGNCNTIQSICGWSGEVATSRVGNMKRGTGSTYEMVCEFQSWKIC